MQRKHTWFCSIVVLQFVYLAVVLVCARGAKAQRRPRQSAPSIVAARDPRPPVEHLRDELGRCPDVADAMDWPVIESPRGDVHSGNLWATTAESLEEMRTAYLLPGSCSLAIVKFGEADVDLAVPIEVETYGAVTSRQVQATILAHGDRRLAVVSQEGQPGTPGFPLARALASMTHEVHDTHLTPHYGFFDAVIRAQPWFDGAPAPARATVWSRDGRIAIGASDPPVHAYVAATEPIVPLAQAGRYELRTSRFTFPYEGIALAAYDSSANRHRWVGVFPGATRMRLGPMFAPDPPNQNDEQLRHTVLLDVTENVEGAIVRAVYVVDTLLGQTFRIAAAGPVTLDRAGIRIRVPRQRAVSISVREIASRLATSAEPVASE